MMLPGACALITPPMTARKIGKPINKIIKLIYLALDVFLTHTGTKKIGITFRVGRKHYGSC